MNKTKLSDGIKAIPYDVIKRQIADLQTAVSELAKDVLKLQKCREE